MFLYKEYNFVFKLSVVKAYLKSVGSYEVCV